MSYSKKKPSLFWPVVLIVGGAILLLSNFGFLPPGSINLLWRFWPLLLVVAGLDILLGRRSAFGAIITTIVTLALIGGMVYAVFTWTNSPEALKNLVSQQIQRQTVQAPLAGVKSADVFIDLPAGPARISPLSDSGSLIEGDISYFGNLYFNTEVTGDHASVSLDSRADQFLFSVGDIPTGDMQKWDVKLHPRVALDLTLDAGLGVADVDLRRLDIRTLTIDAGSGAIAIILPDEGRIRGKIDAGSGRIDLTVPETLAAKIVLDSGGGYFEADSRFRRDTASTDREVWVTEGFSTADNSIELEIDRGSGAIFVK